ncbi:MAG: 23S rRNA (guanosine(2251)-2'-O)-methyltransferase RlmB [Bacilli bacterium]
MYIYGKNTVRELLNSNKKIKKAIISNNFSDKDIVLTLQNENIDIKYSDKKEMDRLVKAKHQGIIVDIDDFKYSDLDDVLDSINKDWPFLLILDHLQDPHNFGAIIRTAESAGIDGIIIPKDRSVDVTATVMKTSAGSIEYIPICKVTNLSNTIHKLKDKGYWIIGADMEGLDYQRQDYKMPIALIIGSEGQGISKLIKEMCDYIVTIPMKGHINSLNASVAAGVIIYKVISSRDRG